MFCKDNGKSIKNEYRVLGYFYHLTFLNLFQKMHSSYSFACVYVVFFLSLGKRFLMLFFLVILLLDSFSD
jgi:hypothetical protein